MRMIISKYDSAAGKVFRKRHIDCRHNGHVSKRFIIVEITAKKGKVFCRFEDVCPKICLDLALQLRNDGWQLDGIYFYYIPVNGYNLYQEASPIFLPNNILGCCNTRKSLRQHCDCVYK